jgi:outer membrane protein OmpA-like peptidoglycan-associated protein
MKWRISLFLLLATLVGAAQLVGQAEDPIYLINPSFEDMPRPGRAPSGWADCGFPGETPPDVQPDETFSVSKPAIHGNTYLGMVVRDNDTWESVSQPLSRPLQKGKCYEFSLFLARSELYISVSRTSEETANYTTPAKLRIYGGFGQCDKQYLLAETSVIINHRWLEYKFKLEPINNYTHIILEAFYNTPTLFPYNGNILVDNASPIVPISCSEKVKEEPSEPETKPIVEARPPAVPRPAPPKPKVEENKDTAKSPLVEKKSEVEEKTEPAKATEEVSIVGLRRSELKKGQTIRIDNLYFEADSVVVKQASFEVLDEIYRFLAKNSDVAVEIGGHTNGLPPHDYCDRLSTQRAKAVADYLTAKGIERNRLQFKGYGKRVPVDTNLTVDGRRKNQRVEIKILSLSEG